MHDISKRRNIEWKLITARLAEAEGRRIALPQNPNVGGEHSPRLCFALLRLQWKPSNPSAKNTLIEKTGVVCLGIGISLISAYIMYILIENPSKKISSKIKL